MAKKQKLELTWVGKDERPKLEPRILIEDTSKSYHAKVRHSDEDIFDNVLIKGDNLLALKALEQDYAGKVKCVFIDPPYNTGSAFNYYDDGLEHSIWLSLLRDRIILLRSLLTDDGSFWVTIDDNEVHYLKVLCDEIFGRTNFVTSICWEKIYTKKNSAKHFSAMHDHILVYAKDINKLSLNQLPRGEKQNSAFKNPDKDERGIWLDSAMHGRNYYSKGSYSVTSPSGKEFVPPPGRYWTVSEENFWALNEDNRIWWGKTGGNTPRKKTFLTEVRQGVVPGTIWFHKDAGQNAEAKNEIKKLFSLDGNEIFITPKPEKLLKQVLTIASSKGDYVLDSFAGTGTTAAVAQKMNRGWITVEIGEHADTHIVPRLQKVIDGEDPGGITKSVDWKGGGGFRYYTLAPSLLETDKFGNWVISKDYIPAMLSEAMCKHMGFKYAPSQDEDEYWQHGHSTEADFIYVTTQNLTHDACKKLSDEVGEGRSLLICCKAYSANAEAFENLTLVKIPTAILAKCEWGQDDYSLNVENLPMADALGDEVEEDENSVDDLPLFAEGDDNA